jgi:hypothetical protein
MRISTVLASLSLSACVLAAGLCVSAARADDVSLTITNNGTSDIVVTVYDLNARPNRPVLAGQRLSGFSSVLVSVAVDGTGRGHVSWTATSERSGTTLCGQDIRHDVAADDSVEVHADADCTQT